MTSFEKYTENYINRSDLESPYHVWAFFLFMHLSALNGQPSIMTAHIYRTEENYITEST